jgi:hypothetical protein
LDEVLAGGFSGWLWPLFPLGGDFWHRSCFYLGRREKRNEQVERLLLLISFSKPFPAGARLPLATKYRPLLLATGVKTGRAYRCASRISIRLPVPI